MSEIYYFAYGANMCPRYLKDVRHVSAIASKRGVLKDYKLTFDLKGLNFLEPGFANIAGEKGRFVEGLLHKIHAKDFEKIVRSEGERYQVRKVLVNDGESSVESHALIYDGEGVEYRPSRRYRNLILNAAREHQFSVDYIEYLKSLKTVYYPLLSELFGRLIYAAIREKALKE